jgi:hypothetical protein
MTSKTLCHTRTRIATIALALLHAPLENPCKNLSKILELTLELTSRLNFEINIESSAGSSLCVDGEEDLFFLKFEKK